MPIPKSKNKLFIKDWIKYQQIDKSKYDLDVDREIALLNHYTGISVDEFNDMSINSLNAWLKKLRKFTNQTLSHKVKRVIRVKGMRYKACKDERDFRANQWMALKHYELNQDDNIHKILSLIYTETKLFKDYKFNEDNCPYISDNLLNNARIGDVYGVFFFYLQRFEGLSLISQCSYLLSLETINNRMQEVYQGLRELGVNTDGSLSSMTSAAESLLKKQS